MTLPILIAVTGSPWESEVVARLSAAGERSEHAGLVIVRRCVDVADLLAAAATGTARVALVWPRLRRFDSTTIAELAANGVAVVGVVSSGDSSGPAGKSQVASDADAAAHHGITAMVPADAPADEFARVIYAAADHPPDGLARPPSGIPAARREPPGVSATLTGTGAAGPGGTDRSGGGGQPSRGRLVAVWGPTGAPGRTSVAVTIASELAVRGTPTMLADADVYGGVVAEVLGIVDDAPGLAAAVRLANASRLSLDALAGVAREVAPGLRVLTGLARAARWPELRPDALATVWEWCRALAAVTVVDCGFCLEQDEELSFDTTAPRRNGATLATLEAADTVCVVGAADPIGVVRLARAVDELRVAVPAVASMTVVVNQLRPGPIGRDPARQVSDVLDRHAGVRPAFFVPYDRAGFDASLAAGRTLMEASPGSAARGALAELAEAVAGLTAIGRERGRRRVHRR